MDELRRVCALVAERARSVRVERGAIAAYASALPLADGPQGDEQPRLRDREQLAAFWLQLNAINFGSGWFPTLRKRNGRSGYSTIAAALHDRAQRDGPWSAAQLTELDAAAVADVLGQPAVHELMALYAASLSQLGELVFDEYRGSFTAVVDAARGSAVELATRLGAWPCFADSSRYEELEIPFLKRAQIAAADLDRAGVAGFDDIERLTMFADNLVPHVLRLDGVLSFDPQLVERIDRSELIEHGSREEVEIRACAVHAVEQIVAARPGSCAAAVDQLLWLRGRGVRYKSSPRHRSRCTAY
jgi:putative queuosine salvage protein